MLTPKQVEVVRVQELEAKERKNDLQRERATIHKVPIKKLNSVVKHCEAQHLDLRPLAVLCLEAEWVETRKTAMNTNKVSNY